MACWASCTRRDLIRAKRQIVKHNGKYDPVDACDCESGGETLARAAHPPYLQKFVAQQQVRAESLFKATAARLFRFSFLSPRRQHHNSAPETDAPLRPVNADDLK